MAEATEEHVIAHLRDVHALEEQSAKLFEIAADELAEDDELVQLYRERLDQSREHEQQINERIEAHDCKPSAVKDLTMSAASSVGLRDLSDKPVDTPVKLTMNFVALQHLKIAGYELLVRIAKDAGDDETSRTAEQLLEQECKAAEQLHGTYERAVSLMLEGDGSEESERSERDEDGHVGSDDEGDEE